MADLMTMERSATMTHEDICSHIEAGTPRALFESRRVLAITPDATRSAPLPALVRAVDEVIGAHARQLDYMVALGTHPIMPDDAIARLYGVSPAERTARFGASRFLNHRWDTPGTLQRIGVVHGAPDLRGHRRPVRRGRGHHHQPRDLRV